jgi:hypothetical protein
LDEQESKHAGLPQQNGFGSTKWFWLNIFPHDAQAGKERKMVLAQQNGFGSTFFHMMLRLVKSSEDPNGCCHLGR